jgi:catechol 2,3-dioxygenase-like lactoylglutathione lyase family enzyme
MLHHVSIEVHPDDIERTLQLLELIGFERVEAPGPIAEYVDWVERNGTQVHLIRTPEPATQHLGHPAFVVDDFEAAVAGLRGAGFVVEDAQELWGQPRAFAVLPGGQRAELMAAPPG